MYARITSLFYREFFFFFVGVLPLCWHFSCDMTYTLSVITSFIFCHLIGRCCFFLKLFRYVVIYEQRDKSIQARSAEYVIM